MIKQKYMHNRFFFLKKWCVFLSVWILSFFLFVSFVYYHAKNKSYNNSVPPEVAVPVRQNELAALSYKSWDPEENYRPVFLINCQKLYTENNELGLFKTALHKVINIDDLRLKFYRYTSNTKSDVSKVASVTKSDVSKATSVNPLPGESDSNVKSFINDVMGCMVKQGNKWQVNIDLGNISEVCIANFDYQIFHDTNLFFAAQSSRATVSYKKSGLMLQGRAKITIADGSTLAGNNIEWDLKNQNFFVKGVYVINHNGEITTGKNICVNSQLESIEK